MILDKYSKDVVTISLCFVQEQVKIFIIVTQKLESAPEVEFTSENFATKRVQGTLENDYTISVSAPGEYSKRSHDLT